MVLGFCCDVAIFKLTASAQSIYREVYALDNSEYCRAIIIKYW